MSDQQRKISIGLKILGSTPAHTEFVIFSSLIPNDSEHENMTRASLGKPQMLRNDEFTPFVLRLRPHIISRHHSEISLPATLEPFYSEQPARGDWDFYKWVWTK